MDQVKEFLRLAVKYRFWIAVGLACLMPVIAYAVGSGKVQQAAAAKKSEIEGIAKGVQEFKGGVVYNNEYKAVVDEKTEELTEDVTNSWAKLYERQAPLLTWPETVEEKFKAWGRKWPEGVDPSVVTLTIQDYLNAYPDYVEQVYQTFHPYTPETDPESEPTGVVVAPPKEMLLKPAQFKFEEPPTLGEVWAAQEKLWVQRTLLDVVARVNKGAQDWDGAIIKQITGLEVGTPTAQDQRSIARGDVLVEAPPLEPEGAEGEVLEEDPAAADSGYGDMAGGPGGYGDMAGPGGGYGDMMAGYGGMMGAGPSTPIMYLEPAEGAEGEKPYQIVPVFLSVYIDQAHINDLLVELANSPMAIQVMDFEQNKPKERVKKPEKGQPLPGFQSFGGGYAGMMGGYGDMMAGPGGYGDMAGYGDMMMPGYGGKMGGYGDMGGPGGYGDMMMPGYGGMMGMGGAPAKTGTSVRSEYVQKLQEKAKAAKEKDKTKKDQKAGVTIHDPYYNIVEVSVWGQARFYNPPPAPEPEAAAESLGEGDASEPGAMTEPDAGTPADVPTPEAPEPTEAPVPTEAPEPAEPTEPTADAPTPTP